MVTNGSPAVITVGVVPNAIGTITNTFFVTTSSGDINSNDNSATVVTLVTVPVPVIVADGVQLAAESNVPPNHGIDSGETVSVNLTLLDVGAIGTTNLVATLQSGNGIQ